MANTAILPVRRKAGLLGFPGPLLACVPAVLLALAVGGTAHARAQDAPPPDAPVLVSVERLKFEFKCYFNIPEWRGRGEETFLNILADQKKVYREKQPSDLPAIEGLMAQGYWAQKTSCEERGDTEGADRMAGMVLDLESKEDKVVKGFRDKADAFVVGRNLAKARKLEADNLPDLARQKYASIVGANDRAIGQEAVSAVVRIVRKQKNYQAVLDSNDLTDIGTMLDGVLAELRKDLGPNYDAFLKGSGGAAVNADLKSVEDEKQKVAGSTQDIQVVLRDVSAALAGVQGKVADTSAATFSLEPEGPDGAKEGKPFPGKGVSAKFSRNPLKWHRGVYTARAFAPGSDRPFAVLAGVALKDSPGVVEIPGRVPEGMLWVPALKPGGEALFVDRTEVTVAQVEAVAGSDETLVKVLKESREGGSDPNLPAYFAEAAYVLPYEKASGRKVPTAEQWLHAAYGGRGNVERPYPWGKEAPDASRAYSDPTAQAPQPVGGRPAGAAACGAEDMVGNLCEWVRKDGQFWVLGGHWSLGVEKLSGMDGLHPAHDPMPQVSDFREMPDAQQKAYAKFKYDPAEFYLSGLRTVVPVPAR